MASNISRTSSSKKRLLRVSAVLVILIAILAILELTNTTHFFHKGPPKADLPVTPTQGGASVNSQKGETTGGGSSNSSGTTQPAAVSSDKGSSTTTNAALTAPTGNFVSNHNPGKNGSPTIETSTCNTTPGATCQIVFSNDQLTKELPAQTTDSNGAVFWNNWSLSSIGLTYGSWQVKAIATLNGQTKSTTDSQALVVSQ